MSNQSNTDAEEALQAAKEQKRHTSQATSGDGSEDAAVDRVAAIKDALVSIEAGEAPENINLRDQRLKALLVALDETGELDTIAATLADELGTDIDTSDVSQSEVARLLLRVGLQEALPDVLDDATEARKEKAKEQADSF